MNRIYYTLLGLLLFVLAGCEKDGSTVDTNFYPRVFDSKGVFNTPSRIIPEGGSAVYSGLLFSPADRVKISWKVNGEEVSTDTTFTFTPTEGGEYQVELAVSNNGDTTYRKSSILVKPSSYTPKPYTHVVLSHLTEAGSAASVDWNVLTHIVFRCGRVQPDGTLDVQAGETNQTADELVARSHLKGVPVLLGISGRLSGIDGWALYEGNDFGDVISDPLLMPQLVDQVKNYIDAKLMDGVEIMMTDVNSGKYQRNIQAIGPFIAALKAALPTGKLVTVTVATDWTHWDYDNTALQQADWIHVHAFEDGAHVAPGAAIGQPSSYDFMVTCAELWSGIFHLIPKEKIVLGIPAFGLQYNELDANGNNASWGSYGYITYKDILAADPQAHTKEQADIAKGVFFNGVPLVTQKATYIKDNGFKGVYIYAGDYDVAGEKSLTGAIYNVLK